MVPDVSTIIISPNPASRFREGFALPEARDLQVRAGRCGL